MNDTTCRVNDDSFQFFVQYFLFKRLPKIGHNDILYTQISHQAFKSTVIKRTPNVNQMWILKNSKDLVQFFKILYK